MTDLGYRRGRVGGVTAESSLNPRVHNTDQTNSRDDDFLTRIQLALGLTPKQLAKALDMPLRDVVDRDGPRSAMSSFCDDPFWLGLLTYVTNQLAGYMAVKEELERKQRLDIRERHNRIDAVRNR